jgi:hypothetical protein
VAKSPTEKINEVSQLTATLTERLDSVRRDVETVSSRGQKTDETVHEVRRTLAVIEERLNELK